MLVGVYVAPYCRGLIERIIQWQGSLIQLSTPSCFIGDELQSSLLPYIKGVK